MIRYLLTLDQAHALADMAGDRSGSIHDFIQGEEPFGGCVGVFIRKRLFRKAFMGIAGVGVYPLKTRKTLRFLSVNAIQPEQEAPHGSDQT